MYGFPPDFDVSVFCGHRVQKVSFTANTIHLIFDNDLSITLEGAFVHQTSSADLDRVEESVPVKSSSLMQLVGLAVVAAEAAGSGTLILRFQDSQCLYCIDDAREFESYRITHGSIEIVV